MIESVWKRHGIMFWNWPSVGLCVFRENCVIISYCQTHTFWSGRFWFLINIIAVCSSLSFNEFFMNRFQFPISHITKLSPLCFTIWRHSIDSFIFCTCCDWFNKIKLKSADEKKNNLDKVEKKYHETSSVIQATFTLKYFVILQTAIGSWKI